MDKSLCFTSLAELWAEKVEHYYRWLDANRGDLLHCTVGIVVTLVVFLLIRLVVRRVLVSAAARRWPAAVPAIDGMISPLACIVLIAGLSISNDMVHFPGMIDPFFDKIFLALFVIVLLRTVLRGIHWVNELLLVHFKKHNPGTYSTNKLLLDLSRSLVKLAVWCFAAVFILQNIFQWKITAVLASAGILGLAIAFAAQNTIANLFGAFSILGSKLFVVGDWIKVGSVEGIVEQIGFRSVRVRAFEGRLIDVPNRIIADSQLENFSNRPFFREHFCYGLVYQTSMEDIRRALQIIDDIGRDMADRMVPGKPPKFSFMLCNASSLDLDGYVWFNTRDWFEMRGWRGEFNREVMARFTAAGLSIAYPTTTVFLEKE